MEDGLCARAGDATKVPMCGKTKIAAILKELSARRLSPAANGFARDRVIPKKIHDGRSSSILRQSR
jgi:hypothetical protein